MRIIGPDDGVFLDMQRNVTSFFPALVGCEQSLANIPEDRLDEIVDFLMAEVSVDPGRSAALHRSPEYRRGLASLLQDQLGDLGIAEVYLSDFSLWERNVPRARPSP